MLDKLLATLRQYEMLRPGDRVYCAVSGGADSMALLFAMYLLREKLNIQLKAAHFNHNLRGAESDEDEAFVRRFCEQYDIELAVGSGQVTAGKKGLEAAARDARYQFFGTLSGKIATAHTADDNAETVLMRLVRGTGLKGLGAIAPVRGQVIRPMLNITRQEILNFLEEYHIEYRTDSSNYSDDFLRNRLRHSVMPLLMQENPRLTENLSAMAQRLRLDEQALARQVRPEKDVIALRQMPPAIRSRCLERLVKEAGMPEPEARHMALVEAVVFSQKPSACATLPNGVTVRRSYDTLCIEQESAAFAPVTLVPPCDIVLGDYRLICEEAKELIQTPMVMTVRTEGPVVVRPRQSGDEITLQGGTKSLKKLFIDRKIPASQRQGIPVVADSQGIVAVCGIGANHNRKATALPAWQLRFEKIRQRG